MAITNNKEPVDTEEKAAAETTTVGEEEIKEKDTAASRLFGDDDRSAYQSQRGNHVREVVQKEGADLDDDGDMDDEPQKEVDLNTVNDSDRAAVKAFFGGYDQATSIIFSMKLQGDWNNTEPFLVYKDLDSPKYKHLIDCACIVYKRWQFKWGPELVVGSSLVFSTWMKYQMFTQLKQNMNAAQAAAAPKGDRAPKQKKQTVFL